MHAFVKSDYLREGLLKILTVVNKKTSRPLLTNCLISAKNNSLEIIATDLEVAAKITCPADVKNVGEFCINAKNISDIIRELPEEQIELLKDENKNLLNIKCTNIKYSLVVASALEYPKMNFSSALNGFKIDSGKLLHCIDKISYAISNDETRPFLNGIFLQSLNSQLRAVAVDGYRLALIDIEDFHSSNKILEDGIIIPKKGIFEIKKLAESFPETELSVSIDESFIYVSVDGKYSIFVRLIAREFPKYQAHIPSKTVNSMMIDKKAFLSAIKRIRILANEKTNGVKLTLQHNKLSISGNHSVFGEAVEHLNINYSGDNISIGFNVRYLSDTLAVLPDSDVIFEFNNELNPVLVRSLDLPLFLGIIMPLKL